MSLDNPTEELFVLFARSEDFCSYDYDKSDELPCVQEAEYLELTAPKIGMAPSSSCLGYDGVMLRVCNFARANLLLGGFGEYGGSEYYQATCEVYGVLGEGTPRHHDTSTPRQPTTNHH